VTIRPYQFFPPYSQISHIAKLNL